MNGFGLNLFSLRRWTFLLGGLLLIVFGSFYFLNVPAKTQTVERKSAEQNLVNGKLAFTRRLAGPTAPDGRVIIANPDGSGQTTLGTPTSEDMVQPAWSPDGTKIAFSSVQPNADLYVMNAAGGGVVNLTNTGSNTSERNPSWSATEKIAYERVGQIWVINPDGTGNAQFSGITQASPTAPAWSPNGAKLAFVSNSEIWVINADGTNEQRVTNNATTDNDPAWSPDGTKIVFAKGGNIAVINVDGTNEMTLATSGSMPSWSPDGTKIAFRRNGIYTMDADGSNQVRIVADVINFPLCCDIIYENPAWQPVAQTPNTFTINGRVAYDNFSMSGVTVNLSGAVNAATTTDAAGNYQFPNLPAGGNYTVSPSFVRHYFTPANRSFNNLSSNQTGNFEVGGVCRSGNCVKNGKIAFARNNDIYTIFQNGTGQTNITNNAANDNEPDWSPDGVKIVFTTDRDGNNEIYRMNAEDDPSPTRLTNNAASDTSARYSPDGSTIVFVSNRDGNTEIYKMNADGSNQVRLTNNTTPDNAPAFSPDGTKIVFATSPATNQARLWTMNADGSNQQVFLNLGGIVPAYSTPSYSPDGSKIIFGFSPDVSTQVTTTWTVNPDGTNAAQLPGGGGLTATYSPDGAKVSYVCCQLDFTNRLRTANANGSSVQIFASTTSPAISPDWQPIPATRRTPFDFDGDGKSDIAIFRPSTSDWWYLASINNAQLAVQWGVSTDVLAPADYDGDLKTDFAVWRPSNGNFYIYNSFDNTARTENFGLSGDIPVGGDWDGDGKADMAVYRPGTQGVFYYRGSMGNPQGSITFIPWGIPGDKAVAADYDGDGRTDAAIYRNGIWYIRQSATGQLFAYNFGLMDDTLVPADYDADGKTDLAVYRGGIWYILRSAQGFTAFQFGISTDTPVPADYDGDGRTDAGVFRDGVWWILKSQTSTAEAVQFGFGTDKPIQASFVR